MGTVRRMVHRGTGLSTEEIQRLSKAWNEKFEALSEEDQILALQAQRIGFACDTSSSRNKEEIARSFLTKDLGPKFTERVLNDLVCRKKLGIE